MFRYSYMYISYITALFLQRSRRGVGLLFLIQSRAADAVSRRGTRDFADVLECAITLQYFWNRRKRYSRAFQ